MSEVLGCGAIAVIVASHRVGVVRWRAGEAVRAGELVPGRPGVGAAQAATTATPPATRVPGRITRLTVGDKDYVHDTGVDRGECVVHMHLEGAAANGRGVDVIGVQTEVLRQLGRPTGAEYSVDAGDG